MEKKQKKNSKIDKKKTSKGEPTMKKNSRKNQTNAPSWLD
jgi:hypothetical protein